MAAIYGSDALDDSLAGTIGDDTIFGEAGADTTYGGAGSDRLFGGLGDDALFADADDVAVIGGSGVDTANYSELADVVSGARDIVVDRVRLLGGDDTFDVTPATAVIGSTFDLNDRDGFFTGSSTDSFRGWAVSSAGDVNGDGFDDAIIAGYGPTSTSGAAVVIFGSAAGWPVGTLNGTNGFQLNGGSTNDQIGYSVSAAGDVNDDGFDDLIVGSRLDDPGGADSGSSYVVFGKASGWTTSVSVTTLDGTTGFRLDGAVAGDQAGTAVSAGDVNGDGFDDLIVGAPFFDQPGLADIGATYVVFGQASGWTSDVDLSALNGTTGFRLDGAVADDQSGTSAASAGDVNGDGFDDVVIGAYNSDANGANSGATWVVFGKASGWTSDVNLSSLNGTTGFRLTGDVAGEESGWSVASAGDVNGDGFDDVIVGARIAAPGGLTNAGSTYVVFGKSSGWTSTLDLGTLNGTTGFRLDGVAAHDQSGRAVASAGDVNGDGCDDLIVGAIFSDVGGSDSGSSYVVFGKTSGWSATMQLSGLDGTSGVRLTGIDSGDQSGFSVASAGDTNGDGFGDLLVGAPQADRFSNTSAGEAYLILGGAHFGAGTSGAPYVVDGGSGNDALSGQSAGDTLYGANDSDMLSGRGGVDWLFGGAGNDTIYGGDANDKLWGGLDGDTLFGGAGTDSLNGKEGADAMSGGDGADYYWVDDAGDIVDETSVGSSGTDTVWVGIDVYTVADGVERINAQLAGGSTITASGSMAQAMYGADGAETLDAGAGNDGVWGGGGGDRLQGTAGDDSLYGGAGGDLLEGGDDDDRLYGGDDADALHGGAGSDVAWGGAGADTMFGGAGDTMFGDAGDDRLVAAVDAHNSVNGGADLDTLALDYSALAGAVTVNGTGSSGTAVSGGFVVTFSAVERRDVNGGSNDDLLRGGLGDDVLDGRGGADQLHGADGIDTLRGDAGVDQLWGGAGGDTLFGGDGADMIQGGIGADVMSGGTGRDTYRISIGDGADTIADFAGGGEDRIDLQGAANVTGGLGTDLVLLTGGGSILAVNGHLWQAADFF